MTHIIVIICSQHISFLLNRFSVKYIFPFPFFCFCFFVKSPSVTQRSVSHENAFKKSKNRRWFFFFFFFRRTFYTKHFQQLQANIKISCTNNSLLNTLYLLLYITFCPAPLVYYTNDIFLHNFILHTLVPRSFLKKEFLLLIYFLWKRLPW